MSIKRYGKTYKNAEEIYNFIKDKKGVVLISIDDLEQKDQRIAELEKQLAEIKSSVSDLIGFYEMNITIVEREHLVFLQQYATRAQIEYIKRQLEKYGIVKSEKPFARCLYLFD